MTVDREAAPWEWYRSSTDPRRRHDASDPLPVQQWRTEGDGTIRITLPEGSGYSGEGPFASADFASFRFVRDIKVWANSSEDVEVFFRTLDPSGWIEEHQIVKTVSTEASDG